MSRRSSEESSSRNDDDSSSASPESVSVSSSQMRAVREHLQKSNAHMLEKKVPVVASVAAIAGESAKNWIRRINIFARAPSIIPDDESSVESNDQITTIGTVELDKMSLQNKRTYLDIRKLRGLPRSDRHLFWEERAESFSCVPLPPIKRNHHSELEDEDSMSSSSIQSSSLASSSYASAESLMQIARTKKQKRRQLLLDQSATEALERELKVIQYLQQQKRKKFMAESILSTAGVRMVPWYMRRPKDAPALSARSADCSSSNKQKEELLLESMEEDFSEEGSDQDASGDEQDYPEEHSMSSSSSGRQPIDYLDTPQRLS